MKYSDFDLVCGIKDGDEAALELLIRRWYPRVFRYVWKVVGHEQDAYDLTQDILLAVMQHLPAYYPWKPFDRWLFTIAHNKCMEFFRLQRNRRAADCLEETLPDPALPLEERTVISVTVRQALEKLPPVQREAVTLYYFHRCTAQEVARLTGAPLPTVKSRLRAAKKSLERQLREAFL